MKSFRNVLLVGAVASAALLGWGCKERGEAPERESEAEQEGTGGAGDVGDVGDEDSRMKGGDRDTAPGMDRGRFGEEERVPGADQPGAGGAGTQGTGEAGETGTTLPDDERGSQER